MCGYSPIEHLAKIVSLSRFDWKEVFFGMFTVCFDASGTVHDQSFLTVGGYISRVDDWIEFDKDWRKRLQEAGIRYFRRAESVSNQKEFKGWHKRAQDKDKLLCDLVEIINTYTYRKFGCMVSNEVLAENLSLDIKRQFHLHAYAFAGIVSVSQVQKWAFTERIRSPIEFIFEDGDDGKGELMENMRMYDRPTPIFRGKTDRQDKNGNIVPAFSGLQAADFLAYEMFQMLRRRQVSKYLRLLHEKIGEPGVMTVKTVQQYNDFFKQIGDLDAFVTRLETAKI